MKDLPKYLRPEWQNLTEEQLRQDRIQFLDGRRDFITPETALEYLCHQYDVIALFSDRLGKSIEKENPKERKTTRNICYMWGLVLMFADDAVKMTEVKWELWLGEYDDCELFTFAVYTEEFFDGISYQISPQLALELIQYLYDIRRFLLMKQTDSYIEITLEALLAKYKKELEYSTHNPSPITHNPNPATVPSSSAAGDLFKYIHPSITDDAEQLQITREIQNLVRTQPMPDICHYLIDMKKANRIYLNVKPEAAFTELHRMGMPDETHKGFSYKNFTKYYNVN